MKRLIVLLFVLLLSGSLQAQEQTTPKDSIILRRFFHAIGRSCKKTGKAVKTVAFNAKQKYHDAPRAANAFDKRFSISLNAGGNYYADFWKKHFPLDTGNIDRETNYIRPSHVSYTHVPGFSFHGGLVCSFQISRHFSVEGGLMYFSRRSKKIYSSDANEIALMDSLNNYPFANYFYSKEISQNSQSIEIPFYFGYTYKRFSALIGTRLILVMIDHKRYVRIDNSVQNSNEIWQPFGEGNQAIDFTIPSIKLRYLINKEKIPISVYCSADWLLNKKWDLVAGVQIGIFSK